MVAVCGGPISLHASYFRASMRPVKYLLLLSARVPVRRGEGGYLVGSRRTMLM